VCAVAVEPPAVAVMVAVQVPFDACVHAVTVVEVHYALE
jgi:hypothetical protein